MQSVLIAVLAALQKTEFMIKTLCTHVFLGNTSTQLALAERTVHADGLTENLSAQTAAAVVTGNAEAADQTDLRLLLPPGFQVNERDLFPTFIGLREALTFPNSRRCTPAAKPSVPALHRG